MKILFSSLACSPLSGSEAAVGYRVVESLSEHFEAEVVTSAGMQTPNAVRSHRIAVQFDDPNDVAAAQLLRFEFRQRRVIGRLLRSQQFSLVHRATPSGYKPSLLAVPPVPLVVGPMLGSDAPPASFRSIFRPRLTRSYSLKSIKARISNGIARRIFQQFSTHDRLLEQSVLILAGSELTRRKLHERFRQKCRLVTYAGVEHDRFTPPAGGRPSRMPQLLFAGRIVPYKGIELLLRAAALARRSCKFELKIVGRGDSRYQDYCRRLAGDLQLAETITFVDHQPREALISMYREADIFCMPSIETYGLAILEAMSSGCVPLVADFNGPGEIVQQGTGLKVPLESPEQFIEEYGRRIIELVEDRARRIVVGELAREHVLRLHDWRRIEESLLEIYDEVLAIRRKPVDSASCCGGPGSI